MPTTKPRKRNPKHFKFPELEQFKAQMEAIENLEAKALCCLLYLSGGRISEIIGDKGVTPEKFVEINEDKNKRDKYLMVYIMSVRTLKKREGSPEDNARPCPVAHDKFITLLKPIKDYITSFKIKDSEPLFKFNRQKADRIIKKNTTHMNPDGLFAHYFRHVRATHLVIYDNFTPMDLKVFFNWKDSRPADNYGHLYTKDIARKMIGY